MKLDASFFQLFLDTIQDITKLDHLRLIFRFVKISKIKTHICQKTLRLWKFLLVFFAVKDHGC